MTRLLLTLLALLTGLAAQVSPAQAAVSPAGEVEVGSVERVRGAVQRAARVAAAALPLDTRFAGAGNRSAPFAIAAAPRIPTVLQGVDRARE